MADKKFLSELQEVRAKLSEMINAGKPPLEIVLEVARLLGEISGEDSFYRTTREQILSVYGLVFKEKFILEDELAEVKARLEKISAAHENPEFTEEERIRIGYALENHRKEIERLTSIRN